MKNAGTILLALALALTVSAKEPPLPTKDPKPPQLHPKPADLGPAGLKKHPHVVIHKAASRLSPSARPMDWPHFLGPTRDGVCTETQLLKHFPQNGLSPIWTLNRGESYSAPSIKDNRLVYQHRIRDSEVIECLDAETGGLYWVRTNPTSYRDSYGYQNGPRASPAIDGSRVYTVGAEGVMHCLDLRSGHLYWQRELAREFGVGPGFFGFCSSPMIEGDLLILNMGGDRGACVAAFDKRTGVLKWLSGKQWGRSYATPIAAAMHGRRILFVFAGGMSQPPVGGLLGLDPASGEVHFRFPWRSPRVFSANSATPTILGNRIYISSSYDVYGAALDIQPDLTHKFVYKTKAMGSHWMTPILRDGYLYGFTNDNLCCMQWSTGKRMWKQKLRLTGPTDATNALDEHENRAGIRRYRVDPKRDGFGIGSFIWADGRFLCLGETGLLAWLELTPKGCKILSSCRLFEAEQTWAAPVLSRGLLYITQNRPGKEGTTRHLFCYDLRTSP